MVTLTSRWIRRRIAILDAYVIWSSSKLLRLVIPVVSVMVIQAIISGGSLEILSAIRAYVIGESLWSKGQKDAVRFIQLYAATGNKAYLQDFDEAIDIPLGDLSARLALEAPVEDTELARKGFIRGGNKPNDIGGLIWLFRYFRTTAYMRPAVEYWRESDGPLQKLLALRRAMEQRSDANGYRQNMSAWEVEIDQINQKLAPLAIAFSESLGASANSMSQLLSALNLSLAATLIAFVVLHIRRIVALQISAERELLTLASIRDAIFVVSVDDKINFANPAACELLGLASVSKGTPVSSLFVLIRQHLSNSFSDLDRSTANGTPFSPHVLIRSDGSAVAVSITESHLTHDPTGGRVLVIRDTTEERNLLDRIAWQASHDSLTELANRREFEFHLEQEMKLRAANETDIALLFVDLDQFKIVNDTCGHAAGDQLLQQITVILLDVVGSTGLVARLGGDEFGVLLTKAIPDGPIGLAERLRTEIERHTFVWNGMSFKTTSSIGLVLGRDVDSAEDALKAADVACFLAKERGRNRVHAHRLTDLEIECRISEMGWVQRIRKGLENGQFCLFAQEIRAIAKDGRANPHFELLLRLHDEDGSLISPGSFLPAAARFGLLPIVDRWVVRTALDKIDQAYKRSTADIEYAINISGVTLGDRDFVDFVSDQFARCSVNPNRISFEITEITAVANLTVARTFIEQMKKSGCRFSLDDFGTGMSSISYLKYLPVDYLKIDGSFIKEMLSSSVDRSMVEMITKIGKILGMKVIAEFVETQEILDELRVIGVDYVQGFAIGRPMPMESAIDAVMSAGHPRLGEEVELRQGA
jgi:diguanylate cyclase (GGDEF)-like protein/PAS domain S-box-containing protein